MTNADMIRALSDEELALITHCPAILERKVLKIESKFDWKCQLNDCIGCKREWLKKNLKEWLNEYEKNT